MSYYTHTPDDWAKLSVAQKRAAVVEAVRSLHETELHRRQVDPGYDPHLLWYHGITASQIASKLGIQGARRAGRGAVKGSWSGTMPAALRIVKLLDGMAKLGLVEQKYDRENYRNVYYPVGES
jgi:hypothetical protein